MDDDFGTAQPLPGKIMRPTTDDVGVRRRDEPNRLIQWAGNGFGTYIGCQQTWSLLPGGVYRVEMVDGGRLAFIAVPMEIDTLYHFPGSVGDKVLTEIEMFWASAEKYAERGFLHRRGYMLYGPQGSGKSSIVQQTIHRITEQGGVVVIIQAPELAAMGLQMLRQIEPTRPVLCIFEDIDAMVQRYNESELLSLLDGETQINYVLNIATTNYPEKLDKRIVRRPRRFDRVIKIGMPEPEVRRMYLQKKLPHYTAEQVEEIVEKSDGFSVAALAELIISVTCLDQPLNEVVKTLEKMAGKTPSSREFDNNQAGF